MRNNTWALPLRILPLVALMLAATPTLLYSAPIRNSTLSARSISFLTYLASLDSLDPDLVNPWGMAFSATISYLGRKQPHRTSHALQRRRRETGFDRIHSCAGRWTRCANRTSLQRRFRLQW